MSVKDHSQITLEEAIAWAEDNCAYDDVCKRLRSRAVARKLLADVMQNRKEKEVFEKFFKDMCLKAVKELKALQKSNDPEFTHIEADKVLCNLLTIMGYTKVVTEYNKVKKWYG